MRVCSSWNQGPCRSNHIHQHFLRVLWFLFTQAPGTREKWKYQAFTVTTTYKYYLYLLSDLS